MLYSPRSMDTQMDTCFGGARNLNVHFHTLVLDGTYRSAENDPHLWFRPAPPPESEELERVLQRVVRGIVRVIEGVARPEWVG